MSGIGHSLWLRFTFGASGVGKEGRETEVVLSPRHFAALQGDDAHPRAFVAQRISRDAMEQAVILGGSRRLLAPFSTPRTKDRQNAFSQSG